MSDQSVQVARERIAAQKGELRGWRPIVRGDVAVIALQVLGNVQGDEQTLGLRVVLAVRSDEALVPQGTATLEWALRKRAVLGENDRLAIVHQGEPHPGNSASDDPLSWPWRAVVIHVPAGRLPAIAGLATDVVPTAL